MGNQLIFWYRLVNVTTSFAVNTSRHATDTGVYGTTIATRTECAKLSRRYESLFTITSDFTANSHSAAV